MSKAVKDRSKISGTRFERKTEGEMPPVQQGRKDVLAVLAADLHLSHTPPILRSTEPSWYKAQKRVLNQLNDMCCKYEAPLILAGDIFHKWNPPPELINFALKYLPDDTLAIPGQHDLPHHSYKDRKKSAYGTLVQAGKIHDIQPNIPMVLGKNLTLYGFPWGHEITSCPDKPIPFNIHLAVIHDYIWTQGHHYPNPPKGNSASDFRKRLKSYDVALFGDNHSHFMYELDQGYKLLNNGCLMRRRADELNYTPSVGLLLNSGKIKIKKLDCSEDKFINTNTAIDIADKALDMTEFLEELVDLGVKGLDFISAVKAFIKDNNIDTRVAKILSQSMETSHD